MGRGGWREGKDGDRWGPDEDNRWMNGWMERRKSRGRELDVGLV